MGSRSAVSGGRWVCLCCRVGSGWPHKVVLSSHDNAPLSSRLSESVWTNRYHAILGLSFVINVKFVFRLEISTAVEMKSSVYIRGYKAVWFIESQPMFQNDLLAKSCLAAPSRFLYKPELSAFGLLCLLLVSC